jgi:voltage-dependent calcium channel L type alpha-1D
LFIFGKKNPIRRICKSIVTWEYFDSIIITIIVISSVVLAIDNPLNDPKGDLAIVLSYIDLCITIIFAAELVMKVIAYGFIINGEDSYLRNGWNVLDFFIVVISVVSLATSSDRLAKLKALRTFRVLKPLRVLGKNENLKLAINSLIRSLPSIGNVLIICVFFWLLLGIICLNYLKGALFYCDMSRAPEIIAPDIEDFND